MVRDYLKRLREQNGLTMNEIAEKLGVSKQYYFMIENGERQKSMDITLVIKLCDIFQVTPETILSYELSVMKGGN